MARRNQDETSMTPPPAEMSLYTLALPLTSEYRGCGLSDIRDAAGTWLACIESCAADAIVAAVNSNGEMRREVGGLRGALQTVDSDIDYALRRANTNGDGSMDHLSATRLIKALATIKAALAGERK